MVSMPVSQNMGTLDRIIRGVLGSYMLVNGVSHLKNSKVRPLESLIGSAFIAYGITGFDPLFAKFGLSTRPEDETFIPNRIRKAMPGSGFDPKLSEQPVPDARYTRRFMSEEQSIADSLRIS